VLTADVKAKTEQVGVLERQLAEAVQEADRARAGLERDLAEERAAFKKEVTELRTRTEEAENKLRVGAAAGLQGPSLF
jgi:tellurite resistance protein